MRTVFPPERTLPSGTQATSRSRAVRGIFFFVRRYSTPDVRDTACSWLMLARLVRMLSCTPSIRNSFCFPSCDSRRGARRRIFPRWANASRARIPRHVRCRQNRAAAPSLRRAAAPRLRTGPGSPVRIRFRPAPGRDRPGHSRRRDHPFHLLGKTGVTAPCGRRVHGTRPNGSSTSAAASRASSTTTGSKHGVPCALPSVRSAAMSLPPIAQENRPDRGRRRGRKIRHGVSMDLAQWGHEARRQSRPRPRSTPLRYASSPPRPSARSRCPAAGGSRHFS